MRDAARFGLSWIVVVSCTSTPPPQGPQTSEPATATATAASAPTAPAPAASATSAGSASATTLTPDAARDARIRQQFGERCRLERVCGDLWGIDCASAADGPYDYVKAETLEVVSRCGGHCMGGRCTNCPPREWKCATY